MNEPMKTMMLAVLAVVLVATAVVVSLEKTEQKANDRVGEMLVDIDPLAVTALKIITFDPKSGQQQRFEVKKTKNGYIIPSHENYPADAKEHLAQAAASINKLKIVSVAGEGSQALEDFGVVDPEAPNLTVGSKNVGMRVTLDDDKGQSLADFIVGTNVEDMRGLRYVRTADKDQVYTLAVDTEYLTTQFGDWIEKDLLQIDPLELERVTLKDYAVEIGQGRMGLNERSYIELDYDSKGLKWNLDKWMTFKEGQPSKEKLAADQELNQQKLDDLKGALDDLQIADVRRKPPGLEGNLQAFVKNQEAFESLVKKGFYPMEVPHPETGQMVFQVLSSQGDVVASMTDGVEYTLRFGGVAGDQAKDEKKVAKPGEKQPDEPGVGPPKLLRYLFVMTRFNQNLIPKPELEKVPDLEPAPADAKDAKPANAAKDAAAKDAKQEEPKKDAVKPDAAKADAPKKDAEKDAAKKDDVKKDDPAKEDPKKDEPAKDAAKADNGKAADQAEKKKEEPKPDPEALKKRRDEIVKENEQRMKSYEGQVAKGKKRVEDLNKRFSAWYYVISDETYQKIHLGQKEVIQKKGAKAGNQPGPHGLPPGFDPGSLVPPTGR